MLSVPKVHHQLQVSQAVQPCVPMDSHNFKSIWENNLLPSDTCSKQTGMVGSSLASALRSCHFLSFVELGKQSTNSRYSGIQQCSLRGVETRLSSSPVPLLSRDLLLAPALPEYSVMKKVITMKGSGVAFGAIISSLMGKNTDALG